MRKKKERRTDKQTNKENDKQNKKKKISWIWGFHQFLFIPNIAQFTFVLKKENRKKKKKKRKRKGKGKGKKNGNGKGKEKEKGIKSDSYSLCHEPLSIFAADLVPDEQ